MWPVIIRWMILSELLLRTSLMKQTFPRWSKSAWIALWLHSTGSRFRIWKAAAVPHRWNHIPPSCTAMHVARFFAFVASTSDALFRCILTSRQNRSAANVLFKSLAPIQSTFDIFIFLLLCCCGNKKKSILLQVFVIDIVWQLFIILIIPGEMCTMPNELALIYK